MTGNLTIDVPTASYLYLASDGTERLLLKGSSEWGEIRTYAPVKMCIGSGSGEVWFDQPPYPIDDNSLDLGSSSYRWRDIYVAGKVDGVDVSEHRHDGTEGHGVAIGGDTMTTPGKETSTTSTSYVTPSGFVFFFNPAIYNASALTGVFTARIRTTDASYTAYARLRNVTDGVDLAEVSTTSTSYTILQSAEFSLPTDAVKRFDVQLKTDGATVYCEGVTLHVRRG